MILLLDASAVVDLLVRSEAGERVRAVLSRRPDPVLLTVGHLDAEVLSALARLHCADVLTEQHVGELLDHLGQLPMQRLPITGDLLVAAWGLRKNVSARDALYVAAAEASGARLVTTDDRLARTVPHLTADLD